MTYSEPLQSEALGGNVGGFGISIAVANLS
jgi:hypothetical protein